MYLPTAAAARGLLPETDLAIVHRLASPSELPMSRACNPDAQKYRLPPTKLLKLGSRPEDITAEEARRERLIEELHFLNNQRSRLIVVAPTNGYVSAPRLRESVGRFNTQGTLLCQVERPGVPRVEKFVAEDDAMSVRLGQPVYFKARALPFETFLGSVERISPATAKPEESVTSQQPAFRQTVVVHCRVDCAEGKLKSGMTGFGRVDRGWSTIGRVLLTTASRYVRTEFWW